MDIKKYLNFIRLTIVALCISIQISNAQIDCGGEGQPPCQEEEEEESPIPLDGGISLLLAAGAAYGAKKVYEYRNQEKEE
jgi:hypothetical protein